MGWRDGHDEETLGSSGEQVSLYQFRIIKPRLGHSLDFPVMIVKSSRPQGAWSRRKVVNWKEDFVMIWTGPHSLEVSEASFFLIFGRALRWLSSHLDHLYEISQLWLDILNLDLVVQTLKARCSVYCCANNRWIERFPGDLVGSIWWGSILSLR